ncbi:MAG TPA: alpha/beta hydrolase [Thermoleophilaceae bacterium]|nr:alpha/beta hydrolase [Thermoleophilaceae bacterium]
MSRAFLILHGIENHRPPGHWQHWLAGRLGEHGHQVLYPGLPEPDAPSLPAWQASLRAHLDELDGAAERVAICHSLACLLWFITASALTAEQRVDRLMLVAPPAPDRLPEGGADFRTGFDPAAVRPSVRGELAMVCSDFDPYNPAGAQPMYGEPIGATALVIEGAGHFTPDSGYGPWPFMEAWCLGAPRSQA